MFDYDTAIADIDCPVFTNVTYQDNDEFDISMEGWDGDE
ncbi:hypothetical protein IGI46_004880 [Enterococcus sp. AZ163]